MASCRRSSLLPLILGLSPLLLLPDRAARRVISSPLTRSATFRPLSGRREVTGSVLLGGKAAQPSPISSSTVRAARRRIGREGDTREARRDTLVPAGQGFGGDEREPADGGSNASGDPPVSPRDLRKEKELLQREERSRERGDWRMKVRDKDLKFFPGDKPFCLIVDGNNVMGAGAMSKAELMKALGRFVETDIQMASADVVLVFDSRGPRSIERRGRMEILFCGKGTLADDVVIDCVEDEITMNGKSLPVIVATSDLELSFRALSKGAHLMKSETLHAFLTDHGGRGISKGDEFPIGHID